ERGGRFHWVAGHWIAEAQLTEERPGLVECRVAPPEPYHEVVHIELRPAPHYVWVHGHWAWHGHWVWVHGHWHVGRPGHTWIRGHWVGQGGVWRWSAGHWQGEAQVAEEEPGETIATSSPPAPYQESILIATRPSGG